MNTNRLISTVASAAAITLMGGLTAFAVEGVVDTAPSEPLEGQVAEQELEEEGEDLILDLEIDTSSDDVGEDVAEGDGPPEGTHGATVSEFARTTTLTGCERGQAVAAVARGGSPEDAKPCTNGGDEALEESGEVEAAGEEESQDGPPHGEAGPPPGKGPDRAAAARGNGRGRGGGR